MQNGDSERKPIEQSDLEGPLWFAVPKNRTATLQARNALSSRQAQWAARSANGDRRRATPNVAESRSLVRIPREVSTNFAQPHLRGRVGFFQSFHPSLVAQYPSRRAGPCVESVRDAVVGRFGLKTAKQLTSLGAVSGAGRVGFFKIYSTGPMEIAFGEDDKHLEFRLSVLCTNQPSPGGKPYLTLSTAVHCHNCLGRLYIFVIAPFHRLIAQSRLRRAARIGWPLAMEAAH